MAKVAQFLAGIPETTSLSTLNRQCASGLQAVATIAAAIRAGQIDVGIGAGVESMSQRNMTEIQPQLNPRLFSCPQARDCLMPMGMTSENVAQKFGITRDVQDAFAAQSQQRAAAARAAGKFDEEIVPTRARVLNEEGDLEEGPIVSSDDGIREGTTKEMLGRLRPAFSAEGSTTAGNSSQMSDGAAAVLLARRSTARALGLPVLGIFHGFATVGVPPSIMGIGPALAIPKVLKQCRLATSDIDVYEINEAFASQIVYCMKELQLDEANVNPNGGAIALGHPLGCTGARQIATLLPELRRRGTRYGVVSMCVGSGMGAAAVIESVVPQ
ncbi:uncharacterized protein MONBRDRAFT_36727 [Monosiga brevicollis MX1]|uniref:acetyl-CoA C-acyltransferase n=1 Tax=Monosiga brevicollis TaxID=81824 RepID=A9UX36_MONBE|nr:uncharacterized protein MONBRDRAFT_36727 [Monosiga brevicollis MX1]EDQ90147.1 predicted protein [Monosiga brevicollis MX1]|eukprot:XP_001744914.1 hypothetical protein [Monosiga brevicollis MX1]